MAYRLIIAILFIVYRLVMVALALQAGGQALPRGQPPLYVCVSLSLYIYIYREREIGI